MPLTDCGLGGDRGAAALGKYLFPARGGGHFGGYAHTKRRVDALVQFDQPWTWHDMRRSVAAPGLQGLGYSVELIEMILNHASGTFRGVAGAYQQHDYAEQKRAALQAWADHLAGNRGKVIPLRGGRR